MSVSADRATVSDFTKGFFYNSAVVIYSRPSSEAGWTFFIQPFHWIVYSLIGASLLLVSALFVCLERYGVLAYRSQDSQTSDTRRPCFRTSIITTLQTFFGALLARAVEYEGVSFAGHVLLSSWLLLSLITVAVYTGKLTAFSVVTKAKAPFRTLGELVRQDEYRWGFTSGTIYEFILSSAEKGDYKLYYDGALRFAEDDPFVVSKDFDAHLSKVLTEPYVVMASSVSFEHYRKIHCQLAVMPELLFADIFAVHLQKDSPYKPMFDRAIETAEELGLLNYWHRKWLEKDRAECGSEATEVVSLSLHLMQSVFALAGAGICLAAMVLGLECLLKTHVYKKRS